MKPNILFLVLDSLRADKCYGDKKTSITPNIDSLIRKGTYFTQTISCACRTIPSISSIITGLYPTECLVEKENIYTLNPKYETHISNLINFGYHPYATHMEDISHIGLAKVFANNVNPYHYSLHLYNGVGETVIEQLKSQKMKEPWIYYLHIVDLHGVATYKPGEVDTKFQEKKYGANEFERKFSAVDVWIGKFLECIDFEKTLVVLTSDHGSEAGAYDSEMEKFGKNSAEMERYDTGIFFKISHKIALQFPKFLLPLRKKLSKKYLGRADKIVKNRMEPAREKIVGKKLSPYEKRVKQNAIWFVGNVYDERFRVPLLFSGYNIPSGQIISQQVSSIDIFPTIAEIIGMSKENSFRRGESILPLIHGDKMKEYPAFLDCIVNSPNLPISNVIGIRTSHYKYFRNRNNPKETVHLFDLLKDPLEEKNIAMEQKTIVNEMEKTLSQIINNPPIETEKEFIKKIISQKRKQLSLKE